MVVSLLMAWVLLPFKTYTNTVVSAFMTLRQLIWSYVIPICLYFDN